MAVVLPASIAIKQWQSVVHCVQVSLTGTNMARFKGVGLAGIVCILQFTLYITVVHWGPLFLYVQWAHPNNVAGLFGAFYL